MTNPNPNPTYNYNKDNTYTFEIARRSVARAALYLDITHMEESALDALAAALLQYLHNVRIYIYIYLFIYIYIYIYVYRFIYQMYVNI